MLANRVALRTGCADHPWPCRAAHRRALAGRDRAPAPIRPRGQHPGHPTTRGRIGTSGPPQQTPGR